jgi:hypothetical protein
MIYKIGEPRQWCGQVAKIANTVTNQNQPSNAHFTQSSPHTQHLHTHNVQRNQTPGNHKHTRETLGSDVGRHRSHRRMLRRRTHILGSSDVPSCPCEAVQLRLPSEVVMRCYCERSWKL